MFPICLERSIFHRVWSSWHAARRIRPGRIQEFCRRSNRANCPRRSRAFDAQTHAHIWKSYANQYYWILWCTFIAVCYIVCVRPMLGQMENFRWIHFLLCTPFLAVVAGQQNSIIFISYHAFCFTPPCYYSSFLHFFNEFIVFTLHSGVNMCVQISVKIFWALYFVCGNFDCGKFRVLLGEVNGFCQYVVVRKFNPLRIVA